jgi:hypothetical protein
MKKRYWITLAFSAMLFLFFGSFCWCCGGFFTGKDTRVRVSHGVGEGKTKVTKPYQPTSITQSEENTPEQPPPLTVPETTTGLLAAEIEKGWVRCVLPEGLPPLMLAGVDGVTVHIRDGVMTRMVNEPEGSDVLLPKPISPFANIQDGIRHLEAIIEGDYTDFIIEDIQEVATLNAQPVATVSWTGAEAGQQGVCTVTSEVRRVDVAVWVTWNDGTPVSHVKIESSDEESPNVKTDKDGRAQIQAYFGQKLTVNATDPKFKFAASATQVVKDGMVFELELDSPTPEKSWSKRELKRDIVDKNLCRKLRTSMDTSSMVEELGERHDILMEGFEESLSNQGLSDAVRLQLSDWMEGEENRFEAEMQGIEIMIGVRDSLVDTMGYTMEMELPDCDAILEE